MTSLSHYVKIGYTFVWGVRYVKAIGFRAFNDTNNENGLNTCSIESKKYPLVVNYAGIFSNCKNFNSDNVEGREDYYLMYIVCGKLNVAFRDEIRECSEGTLLIFPPRKRYSYSHTTNDLLEYIFVHFTGSEAEDILRECEIKIHPQLNFVQTGESIPAKFQSMFDAFAKQDKLRDRELSAIFERILITFSRKIKEKNEKKHKTLHKSIGKILSSYSETINIPDLAALENLSVSRYNSVFRKLMDCSPTEFILNTRMSMACELLSSTDTSVKEVGCMCGYTDSHFFSKAFKKYKGITPKKYLMS